MNNKIFFLAVLSLLVFFSGCTARQYGEGISVRMMADPDTIFANQDTKLYIDIENNDAQNIQGVKIDVFETGILSPKKGQKCEDNLFDDLLPQQAYSFECDMSAKQIDQPYMSSDIFVSVSFKKILGFTQTIEMMTEQEYERQRLAGKIRSAPGSYSYRDNNIEALVDFSDELPLIKREYFGEIKKEYMYIKIRNIGNGFLGDLTKESIVIEQKGSAVKCAIPEKMSPIGNEFQRIACEIDLPPNVEYISNYDARISVVYSYDVRKTTSVKVVR